MLKKIVLTVSLGAILAALLPPPFRRVLFRAPIATPPP